MNVSIPNKSQFLNTPNQIVNARPDRATDQPSQANGRYVPMAGRSEIDRTAKWGAGSKPACSHGRGLSLKRARCEAVLCLAWHINQVGFLQQGKDRILCKLWRSGRCVVNRSAVSHVQIQGPATVQHFTKASGAVHSASPVFRPKNSAFPGCCKPLTQQSRRPIVKPGCSRVQTHKIEVLGGRGQTIETKGLGR